MPTKNANNLTAIEMRWIRTLSVLMPAHFTYDQALSSVWPLKNDRGQVYPHRPFFVSNHLCNTWTRDLSICLPHSSRTFHLWLYDSVWLRSRSPSQFPVGSTLGADFQRVADPRYPFVYLSRNSENIHGDHVQAALCSNSHCSVSAAPSCVVFSTSSCVVSLTSSCTASAGL